jgi:TPP-dependent pyruvate/acetoin dehydrogenase alpha subunit
LKDRQGQLSDEEWQAMDAEIVARVERAVAFAKASPFPTGDDALEDIYAD